MSLYNNRLQEKPQVTTLITEQKTREEREAAFEFASKLSDRQILTHMGIQNALVYRATLDFNACNNLNGDWDINPENWLGMLNCESISLVLAADWTSEYLKKHWPKAFHTIPTVMTYRKQMLELGFFTYDIENRPKGAAWGKKHGVEGQGTARPPILEDFNLAKTLIWYQVFNKVKCDRIEKRIERGEIVSSLDGMPEHGGKFMIFAYNTMFNTIGDFSGKWLYEKDLVVEVIDFEPIPTPQERITWYGMAEKMAKKARSIVKRIKKIITVTVEVVSKPQSPMGEAWEIPY